MVLVFQAHFIALVYSYCCLTLLPRTKCLMLSDIHQLVSD